MYILIGIDDDEKQHIIATSATSREEALDSAQSDRRQDLAYFEITDPAALALIGEPEALTIELLYSLVDHSLVGYHAGISLGPRAGAAEEDGAFAVASA